MHFQSRMQKPALVRKIESLREYEETLEHFQNSAAYNELIVVVAPSAEQSLEFKLLQERHPNVTVINQRSLDQDEFRTRSFISSSHFVVAGTDSESFSSEELEELLLHTAYFKGQIMFANDVSERYSTSDEVLKTSSLVSTEFFKDALKGLTLPTLGI